MTEKEKANRCTDVVLKLDRVLQLDEAHFRLWKFHEERAERLGVRLWTMGVWLITIVTGALSVPFAASFIVTTDVFPHIQVNSPFGTGVIAVFGLLFSLYAHAALRDMREHIERNWQKAGYVLEETCQAKWEGRKAHGWNVLRVVGGLSFAGFFALLIIALVIKV